MRRSSTVRMNHREFRQGEVRRIHLLRLSEKGKRSLPCSLTEHQNGTFRPIFASQHVQIRARSVVRTPFRTVSKAKFAEIVIGEVQLRRISILRAWVNKPRKVTQWQRALPESV